MHGSLEELQIFWSVLFPLGLTRPWEVGQQSAFHSSNEEMEA